MGGNDTFLEGLPAARPRLTFLAFETKEGESELAHTIHDDGSGEGRDGEADGEEEYKGVGEDEHIDGLQLTDFEHDNVLAYS